MVENLPFFFQPEPRQIRICRELTVSSPRLLIPRLLIMRRADLNSACCRTVHEGLSLRA